MRCPGYGRYRPVLCLDACAPGSRDRHRRARRSRGTAKAASSVALPAMLRPMSRSRRPSQVRILRTQRIACLWPRPWMSRDTSRRARRPTRRKDWRSGMPCFLASRLSSSMPRIRRWLSADGRQPWSGPSYRASCVQRLAVSPRSSAWRRPTSGPTATPASPARSARASASSMSDPAAVCA